MSADRRLPTPEPGRWAAEAFVAEHLQQLTERRRAASESPSSSVFRGGQQAAEAALERFTIDDYDRGRLEVYPQPRRTVSHLSPWIRHGLLSLPRLWQHAAPLHPTTPSPRPPTTRPVEPAMAASAGAARRGDVAGRQDADERQLFRGALLQQEYARHWYARLGRASRDLGQTAEPPAAEHGRRTHDRHRADPLGDGWDRRLGCIEITLDELEEDGWLPDPARRWLAGQLTVRAGRSWTDGDEFFHRHLIDGSRAAGRLGWLRVAGAADEGPQTFSRWDVEQRAPGLCASCELVRTCPIERPDASAAATARPPSADPPLLYRDPSPELTAGPLEAIERCEPEVVWLTAESLGDADPALSAHPDLPAVFVFDERLLARLRLSSTRLSFLVESLSDLATRRTVEIWLGDPVTVVAHRSPAVTFTPVPGWRRRSALIEPAVVHPWPWLCRPHDSRIDSFGWWIDGFASTVEETIAGSVGEPESRLSSW